MKIDRNTLSARSWAVPAISGCLILHHDFKTPRLARVHRLVWSASAVDVHLQYGTCNLSGNVIDAMEMVVTLHQDGAIGIRDLLGATDKPRQALLTFLAGEVHRESLRWAEELQSWERGEALEVERAAILSIVSALVAHPIQEMSLQIEKEVARPASIRKACLFSGSSVIDITPAGKYGVNLYTKGSGVRAGILSLVQEHDLRQPGAEQSTHGARLLKRASVGARQLMRLPFGAVEYLCKKRQGSAIRQASEFVEYLPQSVIDAHAGDSLSALSN